MADPQKTKRLKKEKTKKIQQQRLTESAKAVSDTRDTFQIPNHRHILKDGLSIHSKPLPEFLICYKIFRVWIYSMNKKHILFIV